MTDHKDIQQFFGGISAGAMLTTSFTGGVASSILPTTWSIGPGFTPNRTINIGDGSVANLKINLATLIIDLLGVPRG